MMTVQVEYEYDSLGICTRAKATADGKLVGEATLEEVVKGEHYVVREIHYSLGSGERTYEGYSKYSVYGGMKISEEGVEGQKKREVFATWP
jgi:hypothetical protein